MKTTKILTLLMFLLLIPICTYAYGETVDYQNDEGSRYYLSYNGNVKFGLTNFTASTNYTVANFSFPMRNGVENGGQTCPAANYIYGEIWTQGADGLPDVLLANSTNQINCEDVVATVTNYTFQLNQSVELVEGTNYIVGVEQEFTYNEDWYIELLFTNAAAGKAIFKGNKTHIFSVVYSGKQLNFYMLNSTPDTVLSIPNASFIPPTPADNAANNSLTPTISINVTCTNSGNATIWFGKTADPTNLVSTAAVNKTGWALNDSVVDIQAFYYYKGGCSIDGATGINSSVRTFRFDNISPSILPNPTNIVDAANITQNIYENNIQINYSVTDDLDLFAFLINFTYPNGTEFYTMLNNSANGTNITFTTVLDVSAYPNSISNKGLIYLTASDSHTNNKIRDYKPSKIVDGIRFETTEGNIVRVECTDSCDIDAEKLEDRYTLDIEFTDGLEKKRTFFLSSNSKLYFQDTKFKAHFVISNDGLRGNWIDWEGIDSDYTITQLDDYNVRIDFDKVKDKIKTQSIGGLNVNTKVYAYSHLTPLAVTYTNYTTYSSENYTRSLHYSVAYICSEASNLTRFLNKTETIITALTCDNVTRTVSGNYDHPNETTYFISFGIKTGSSVTYQGNGTFQSDLYNPTATANFNISNGFVPPNINYSARCTDITTPLLNYNITFNGVELLNQNKTNNTLYVNTTAIKNGQNNLTLECSDFFGSTYYSTSHTGYTTEACLVDEKTGLLFNASNLTSAVLYIDDNRSSFDLQTGVLGSCTNITVNSSIGVRYELEYSDGDIITRYINPRLSDNPARVCANLDGTTHYQQLIFSALQKDVVLNSLFANCHVAADVTRFAYQDSFILQAFTIDRQYYLYTYDNGQRVYLAAVDGSLQALINLDIIEFQTSATDVTILSDTLKFYKSGTSTIRIYYKNLKQDNKEVNLVVTNTVNDVVLFNSSTFTDPDEFNVYLNYAGQANVTNNTLFKATVTKTNDLDEVSTLTRYFNVAGKVGFMSAGFALIIAILATVFGFTFTVARLQFSFFGIFLQLGAIIWLSFSVAAWYITFFQFVLVILLIYSFIVLIKQGQPTIA